MRTMTSIYLFINRFYPESDYALECLLARKSPGSVPVKKCRITLDGIQSGVHETWDDAVKDIKRKIEAGGDGHVSSGRNDYAKEDVTKGGQALQPSGVLKTQQNVDSTV